MTHPPLQGLYVDQAEHVVLKDADLPELGENEVRVRPTLGSIKHGTLFNVMNGGSALADRVFDHESRLFRKPAEGADRELMVNRFIGNMVAGVIEEVGSKVSSRRPGERVYGLGPLCTLVTKSESAVHVLPADMSEADAVCVDPAVIALGAVRDGRVSLGDTVAIFGLGAIGLFLVQMARACGCTEIYAVDPMPKRRALAERYGATAALDPAAGDVAVAVRRTRGAGLDVAFEVSGSYSALKDALRCVRNCARVVTVGVYKGSSAALDLGAEWVHNRLEMVCSMPDWDNPSREYPLWDRSRLPQTVESLFRSKLIQSDGILDPIVDFEDCDKAFMAVYRDAGNAVKLAVRFPSR